MKSATVGLLLGALIAFCVSSNRAMDRLSLFDELDHIHRRYDLGLSPDEVALSRAIQNCGRRSKPRVMPSVYIEMGSTPSLW